MNLRVFSKLFNLTRPRTVTHKRVVVAAAGRYISYIRIKYNVEGKGV